MKFSIPSEVKYIIDALEQNGFEAYIVGGCLRDILLDKESKDWDICTSALPEQIIDVFVGQQIIPTGLKHGTVTLVVDCKPYEITTFRKDGGYSDNRHPDTVEFVSDLKDDLARRDFTINAMAYNPNTGIVDYFNGTNDLRNNIIKCVGNSNDRFQEDALRIMRALRFATQLGFTIEKDTSEAIHKNKALLKNIAVERIAAELNKLIVGENVGVMLTQYVTVITEFIPELTPAIAFEQNNPYHCYDVFAHTMKSIDFAPRDVALRLTMLFHDIAKPQCYTKDEDGVGHFYGHPAVSADMAKEILLRLKYDNDTIDTVTQLVLYHDAEIQPRRKSVKRWLNRIGEERLRQLLLVKSADAMAQAKSFGLQKLAVIDSIESLINEIIEQQQCFSLKDLEVNGRDLIDLGVPEGVRIGAILNQLMDMVIDEEIDNDRAALIRQAERLKCE